MSPQCSYFQNYSDLLTLLQCQRVTNVTIAVQVHINLKNKKNNKKSFFFFFFFLGAEIPRQIIVKSASDAEIPLPRKNRGSTDVPTITQPQRSVGPSKLQGVKGIYSHL